ncbi:fimbrial protein [Pseudomonas fontis]|uniref:Fimbrial protein n=1 Tax=Pseudomonas fontis TaxID=2942633 RepID=A0ABT5NQ43_9PSED|nr:hypothetical protein [Pseudomonas fontis]MDD0972838.1 hypothetical protein [Pseudomonas fontis]MDD0990295.1 hypothetical protein [Pseudomonas fontis]
MKYGLLSVLAGAVLVSASTAALAARTISITGTVIPATCVLNFNVSDLPIGSFEADDLLNKGDGEDRQRFDVVPTAGCIAGSKMRLSAPTNDGDYYNIVGGPANALALKINSPTELLKPNVSYPVVHGTTLVLTPRIENFNGDVPAAGSFAVVLTATYSPI